MEFNENKPIYLQLADQIMDCVESSPSQQGERLPSVRDYAANSGVNANTVMRAYTWLQQEGVIYNQRGIGYFYATDAQQRVLEMRRKIFFDKELKYLMGRLAALRISPDEFSEMFRNFIRTQRMENGASSSGNQ